MPVTTVTTGATFVSHFETARWSEGWLSEDGTSLTIEFGELTCYRSEHRTSAADEEGRIVVRLEWRLLEEPPTTCLPIGRTMTAEITLPRPASPDEIIDAFCPDPSLPPPMTSQPPPGASIPEPAPTSPGQCHVRPITVGSRPSRSDNAESTLPPLDDASA